ncbi:MAG: hypothetical protein SF187_29805 [Deltaproteobacteria bacterium]|nr:hypothetical protein [Deltaproteobacteria bacterium]
MGAEVSIADMVDALDAASNEMSGYVNRLTGEVRTVMHQELLFAEEEADPDMPKWQQDAVASAREVLQSKDWLELPSKLDIHEWDIMDRFGGSLPRQQQTEVREAIRGSGAFRNFKRTIRRLGIEDAWFTFKRQELGALARRWLEEHGLQPAEAAQPSVELAKARGR